MKKSLLKKEAVSADILLPLRRKLAFCLHHYFSIDYPGLKKIKFPYFKTVNIAHYLTFFRILIVPFFPVVYLRYQAIGLSLSWMPYILLIILIICEMTDVADGFIARKRNEVSDLGKVLDPMADSITRIAILLTFTQGAVALPLLLVFVFLYREFVISTLRTVCAMRGYALAARASGKIKAVIQAIINFVIVILLILLNYRIVSKDFLQTFSFYLVLVAAIYSVGTAVEYLYANREHLKKIIKS